MISIGCGFGGPERKNEPIGMLIIAAMNRVAELRAPYAGGSVPEVNVVFYVPGSISDFPPLENPKPSRFSRKRKLLLVEVYVPREVADADGSVEFVIKALHKANAIAAEVFAKKGSEPFDLPKAEAIVERVKDALVAQKS